MPEERHILISSQPPPLAAGNVAPFGPLVVLMFDGPLQPVAYPAKLAVELGVRLIRCAVLAERRLDEAVHSGDEAPCAIDEIGKAREAALERAVAESEAQAQRPEIALPPGVRLN